MALPSGAIKFSDYNTVLGKVPGSTVKMSSMYSFASGVPTTGTIKSSQLQGKSAGVPALTAGITLTSSTVGCAYSLRNLNQSYSGPVVNIRRSSDNATVDLYATTSGSLLCTNLSVDILTWLNGATAYVTKWYDQVAGNHAIQTNTSYQPILRKYSAGGKFVLYFQGGQNDTRTSGFNMTTGVSTYGVACQANFNASSTGWQSIVCTDSDNQGLRLNPQNVFNFSGDMNDYTTGNGSVVTLNGSNYTGSVISLGSWFYIVSSRTTTPLTMISVGIPGMSWLWERSLNGYMYEIILFKSTPSSSDRSTLYSNKISQ